MLPEAAQGALALQVRAGEEQLVSSADSAETRRRVEQERACVARIGAGCLAPVAAHHDGRLLFALIAAEDGSWIERASGDDPEALASCAARREAGRVKVIVTRPRAQAQPLVARIEALGHEVVECPLIEVVRNSDEAIDCAGYEWAIVTSPNGADEVARRARNIPKVAAVGPGTAETLRGHGIEPAFVASVSSADGLSGRVRQARGSGALPRGRERAARADRRARGRFRAALCDRAAPAGAARGRRCRDRVRVCGAGVRLDRRHGRR